MELAGVLLVTSVLLVVALLVLTMSLMRFRYTARQLESALVASSVAQDRAALLLAVASAVNSSLSLHEVLDVALTQTGRIMGAVAGGMYLVTPGKHQMERHAAYNLAARARGSIRHMNEEPLRSVLSLQRPLVMQLDEDRAPGLESGGHPPFMLAVPIQRSGQVMGVIELYVNAGRDIDEHHTELLLGVAAQTAIAIRHAQLFQAQEATALTDELTKLPNRRYLGQRFLQEVQRARRHHKPVAFLMIDLDHFKQVNDTHGHLTGDAVLTQLAGVLTAGVRDSDVCARYGGEEFGVILHETGELGARKLADRLRAKVEETEFATGLRLTISIGLAATDEPAQLTLLMEKADEALYAAKQGGRNQVRMAELKPSSERAEG